MRNELACVYIISRPPYTCIEKTYQLQRWDQSGCLYGLLVPARVQSMLPIVHVIHVKWT